MKVLLIRHADAGDRESWVGEDHSRPLSDKGWRQARGLVEVFAKEKVEGLASSPFLRCVQTLEPLAEALGAPITPEPRLAEGASWREAMLMITQVQATQAMCSQGDVIAGIVDDLVGAGVIPARDARWQKAGTWALTIKSGRVDAARYIPPPKV